MPKSLTPPLERRNSRGSHRSAHRKLMRFGRDIRQSATGARAGEQMPKCSCRMQRRTARCKSRRAANALPERRRQKETAS
eukprot:scaffold492_cov257-Pinguiococcus_pyrenoidosus.AAC.10